MARKLFYSLIILMLALFAAQGRLLMAQSADGDRGTRNSPGPRQGQTRELAPVSSRATSSQIPESDRDPGAIGMAKTRGYEFRSIDYPGQDETDLYDFNGKTAVGCALGQAFTFHGNSYALLNIPGATEFTLSCAYGINTSGKIVGNYNDSSNHFHGFLYDGSGYTIFDYPGSGFTQASDINDAGLIVGEYSDSNGVNHGFLY